MMTGIKQKIQILSVNITTSFINDLHFLLLIIKKNNTHLQ